MKTIIRRIIMIAALMCSTLTVMAQGGCYADNVNHYVCCTRVNQACGQRKLVGPVDDLVLGWVYTATCTTSSSGQYPGAAPGASGFVAQTTSTNKYTCSWACVGYYDGTYPAHLTNNVLMSATEPDNHSAPCPPPP